MIDGVVPAETNNRPAAERVAFDHLVMIRLHMDALVSVIKEVKGAPFSPRSILKLRRGFLDVRMVIEELMLLSVSAHQEAGEEVAANLRKFYQADKKMALLRALNVRFFPDAIEVVPCDDPDIAGQFVQISGEYLTENDAKSYYNKCGDRLHAGWKQPSVEALREDLEYLERFALLTSRLLKTFEIDISGQGYMMLGHLNLGEAGPPALFLARSK
jgi:hypothetical protein